MRSSSKLVWVRLSFRVNDLEFEDALIRPCEEDPTDFQLVVEHRAVIGVDGTTSAIRQEALAQILQTGSRYDHSYEDR